MMSHGSGGVGIAADFPSSHHEAEAKALSESCQSRIFPPGGRAARTELQRDSALSGE